MGGQSLGLSGLVGSEEKNSREEAEGIIWSLSPLPRLAASQHSRKGGRTLREEAEFRRSQSTEGVSGSRGREEGSHKLTKAHRRSVPLRIAEDEPVAVYYLPTAFEELEDAA